MLLSTNCVYFDTKNKILTKNQNKHTIQTDVKLNEDLEIPDKINNIPVEKLDAWTFYNLEFKTIKLGNYLKKLPDFCFRKSKFTELTISKNLQALGDSCFRHSQLKELTIPKSVEYIGESCFNHSPLTTIIFENKNIELDMDCFYRANLKQKPNIFQENLKKSFNNSAFIFDI